MNLDPHEAGGSALVVGFLLVLAVLFRDPVSGLQAAFVAPHSVLYFLVFPVVGLGSGVYVYADGTYSGIALFLPGSYLGVFGVALIFGGLLTPNQGTPLVGVGIILLSSAIVSITASIRRFVSAYRSTVPTFGSQ